MTLFYAAFNGGGLATQPHKVPFTDNTLYLPVLYKTKRQAKKEGWTDIRKVKVIEVQNDKNT